MPSLLGWRIGTRPLMVATVVRERVNRRDQATKAHLAVAAPIKCLNYGTRGGSKNIREGIMEVEGRWRTFGIAHMYNVMARVKHAILAHIMLVGAPEGDLRRRRKGDEQAKEVYLAPLGLKTLHIGQTLVAT